MSSDPNKQGQYPPPQWESQPQRGAYPAPPNPAVNYRVSTSAPPETSPTDLGLCLPNIDPCFSASSTRVRKFSLNTRRDDQPATTSASATPSSRHVWHAAPRHVCSLPARPTRHPAAAYGLPESAGTTAADRHRVSVLQTAQGTLYRFTIWVGQVLIDPRFAVLGSKPQMMDVAPTANVSSKNVSSHPCPPKHKPLYQPIQHIHTFATPGQCHLSVEEGHYILSRGSRPSTVRMGSP